MSFQRIDAGAWPCPAAGNAGYALSVGDLVIELSTLDAKGEPVPSQQGSFTLVVRMNGVPYNGVAEIDGICVSVQSGILRLDGGISARIPNIWKGIEFSVRQFPKETYLLDGEEWVTGRVEACRTKRIRFVNREKALGQLYISTENRDSTDVPRILQVRGPSFPAGEERILLPARTLILSGLVYGEYRIGEHPGGGLPPGPEQRVLLSMEKQTGIVTLASGPDRHPRPPHEAAGFLSVLSALSRPQK